MLTPNERQNPPSQMIFYHSIEINVKMKSFVAIHLRFRFAMGLYQLLFHALSLSLSLFLSLTHTHSPRVYVVPWFVPPFHVASISWIWRIKISVLSSGKCRPADLHIAGKNCNILKGFYDSLTIWRLQMFHHRCKKEWAKVFFGDVKNKFSCNAR